MRQKVENEICCLNAYLYDVASTMEFYYLCTAWYMYMQSKRISEMLMWSLYDCQHVHLALKEYTGGHSIIGWNQLSDVASFHELQTRIC